MWHPFKIPVLFFFRPTLPLDAQTCFLPAVFLLCKNSDECNSRNGKRVRGVRPMPRARERRAHKNTKFCRRYFFFCEGSARIGFRCTVFRKVRNILLPTGNYMTPHEFHRDAVSFDRMLMDAEAVTSFLPMSLLRFIDFATTHLRDQPGCRFTPLVSEIW